MLKKSLILLSVLSLLSSCREKSKNDSETEEPPIEVTIKLDDELGERENARSFCFASRTATPEEMGDTYNYQFIRLHIGEDGKVSGTMLNDPYGTDGSRGSISGIFREGEKLVQSTTTYMAEGELYEEQRDYRIGGDGIALLDADRATVLSVPSVSCEQYDALLKEYEQGIIRNRVNTTDRTRLKKAMAGAEYGFSESDLENLRFMELPADLDHDYETREYLLYVMDPMVCGSGGCNLMVIDGDGEVLSSISVVKLPVFLPVPGIADMQEKGSWKPIYVWSQGFRKLMAEDGKYPGNASTAPEVYEGELRGHPERYSLVLDYLD